MDEIKRLEEEIAKLPIGYISNKKIGGKVRHYMQWTENGKLKSKYIPESEYETVCGQIARRKELQTQLQALTGKRQKTERKAEDYELNVVAGDKLRALAEYVRDWEYRDCYAGITTYLYGKVTPRVCSVYGLRRTGKTTMLHQAIYGMNEADFSRAVYIKARKNQTMTMLDRDLKKLFENGYRYVFIDEITLLEDFVDTAAFLSDIYAAMGMKIVLSGTDSLGLWFAAHEELYDRAYTIHTTWIPYAEHARLLGVDDVDEYIRYGGTLRVGETDFGDPELKNEEVSFRDDETTRRYIDTAICGNIQHSLKCYDNGTHFRHLQELYEAHELTGAINRIIEDMNHRFVVDVLTRDFESGDLKLSKRNLLRERNANLRSDALDKIDAKAVTDRLKELLEIRNRSGQSVEITEAHVYEVKEYLKALELIESGKVLYDTPNTTERETVLFTQPGMRYCQAQALVYSLKQDAIFAALNEWEREYVCNRILDEVKGRMLEEIALYETMKKTDGYADVFKFQFAAGEFDMVVYNKQNHTCRIYEIKHSTEAVAEQRRHLTDVQKCEIAGMRFGNITGKYVLYRGEEMRTEDGIQYLNVSEFLKGLPETAIGEDPEQNERDEQTPIIKM